MTLAPAAGRDAAPSLKLGLLLAMQAAMQPRRRFLVGPMGRSWSFHEADAAASHVGWSLRQLGVTAGEPVLLMTPNSDRAAIALAGAMRAGCKPLIAPADLPFADGFALAASLRPVAIIGETSETGGATMAAAARLAAASPSVRRLLGFGDHLPNGATDLGERIERARVAIDMPRLEEATETASIRFASAGAEPAEWPMAEMLAACVSLATSAGLRSGDRIVSPLPPDDPCGLVCGLFLGLFVGAELALLDAPNGAAIMAALDGAGGRHLVWPRRRADLLAPLLAGAPPLRSLIRRGRDIDDDQRASQLAERTVDVTARDNGRIDVRVSPGHLSGEDPAPHRQRTIR